MPALFVLGCKLKRYIFLIQVIIFVSGCSITKKLGWSDSQRRKIELKGYTPLDNKDYADHLKSHGKTYLQDKKDRIVKLEAKSVNYLRSILKNIRKKNELFFDKKDKAKFYIIKSNIPFHFSLPGREFFFSSALVTKYVKNEAMLYSLISYELIRSDKLLYKKKIIIPTGSLETQKIMSLLRISMQEKVEVHKWAYYILNRVGVDTDMYLTWLQQKNRNSLDFAVQLGDTQLISREEALYKSFVIEQEQENKKIRAARYGGSSKNFYTFKNNIRG